MGYVIAIEDVDARAAVAQEARPITGVDELAEQFQVAAQIEDARRIRSQYHVFERIVLAAAADLTVACREIIVITSNGREQRRVEAGARLGSPA